jgi:uncharacterized protein (TIGR00251 family)
MIAIKSTDNGLTFTVYVQPRSSQATIVGIHRDAIKIKLTAPPVGGAANKQCIQILAKALGVPKSSLSIDTGQTSRRKQIRFHPGQGRWSPSQRSALEKKICKIAGETT